MGNTNSSEERRTDLRGSFLTQKVTGDDDRVWRLRIGTGDGILDVFLTSARDGVRFDLQTGRRYIVAGARVCEPPGSDAHTEYACRSCGGRLREWTAVDDYPAVREALSTDDVEGEFYVVDEATDVSPLGDDSDDDPSSRVDDWRPWRTDPPAGYVCVDCDREYDSNQVNHASQSGHSAGQNLCHSPAPADTVGLATGGANDATTFRENVERGYTPQPDALAYEGLFHDYRFPTRGDTDAEGLFVPTCSQSVSTDPVTGDRERYLAVGLDSSLSMDDFERPSLDLVAVLDVSGSMSSRFDEYYYDATGTRRQVDPEDSTDESKMAAAAESLCALTEHLDPSDRFGVVLYNSRAHVAKPLRRIGSTDMDAIRRHIRDVQAGGGTDMAAGFDTARSLLDEDGDDDRERRLVFMTDAMPNRGTTGTADLIERVADAATDGIHTTFVGMGIDANAELMADLSAVRGANHQFVHSPAAFERRLGEEFDYLVSPLAYDLSLDVEATGHDVVGVYGSPNADAGTGRALHVETLFPTPTSDGESRGGVVLVQLDPVETDRTDGELHLHASWTERDGTDNQTTVSLPLRESGHDDDGVRKAVALTRYARTLRDWAQEVHDGEARNSDEIDDWRSPADCPQKRRSEHERESVPLRVTTEDAERFAALHSYLATECDALDDPSLSRELDVLEALCTVANGGLAVDR